MPTINSRNKVKLDLRKHMIDWILEIQFKYSIHQETLFLAFEILDLFSVHSEQPFSLNDFHLVGMVSILIATKMDSKTHFSSTQLSKNIGYEKFSVKDIVELEGNVLKTLDFRLFR